MNNLSSIPIKKKIEFDSVNDSLIFVFLANKLSSSPNLDSIIK